jgi:hypothetical protein
MRIICLKLSEDQKDNSALWFEHQAGVINWTQITTYRLIFLVEMFLVWTKGLPTFTGNSTSTYGIFRFQISFSNLSLIYSDYYYGLEPDFVGFKWTWHNQNYNIKYDFRIMDSFKLPIVNAIYYDFIPEPFRPSWWKFVLTLTNR